MNTTYRGYSIEHWSQSNTWSIYNLSNSMYDYKDGFKSIDAAKAYIDKWAAQ